MVKVATYPASAPRPGERVRSSSPRPWQLWPLLGLLGLLSLGGFIGGLSFVRDASGGGLGANVSWLHETPVSDYFLPGLFLLGVYGIGSLILMVGLVWRMPGGPLPHPDARPGRRWAWIGTIGQGATLVLWILYEFLVLPDQMLLQPILIVVGLLMLLLALMPPMRGFYANGAPGQATR